MWEEFPPISTAEWEDAIRAELNGAEYNKTLLWRTEEGFTVRPFYRREDLPKSADAPRLTETWRVGSIAEIPKDAVRGDLLQEQGATAVQEIGYSLAESSGKRSTFVFGVGCNYFFEIAKLRAARQLWARLSGSPMVIWARTLVAGDSLGDSSNKMIRCTTEAMSAIFGGCDVLVVEAPQVPAHLAESLPRVLAEESHFDQVSDPAGGSYYIEMLTASIAAEAWKVYGSGQVGRDAAIAASRKTREHREG
jgi:methylmalonyl-CoA mutase N-terminal domain/subunit